MINDSGENGAKSPNALLGDWSVSRLAISSSLLFLATAIPFCIYFYLNRFAERIIWEGNEVECLLVGGCCASLILICASLIKDLITSRLFRGF